MIGCERHFGNPEGIRQLAATFLETGNGLDELVAELRRDVGNLVPQGWSGQAATAFSNHSQAELKVAAEAAQKSHTLARAAEALADELEAGLEALRMAEQQALLSGLRVSEGCIVVPVAGWTASAVLARQVIQEMVEGALESAEAARRTFRAALAESMIERLWIRLPAIIPFIAMMAEGFGGGGGRRPGPRTGIRPRKPPVGSPGAAEWRYQRYLANKRASGEKPKDFDQWKRDHYDPVEAGQRPGRAGGPQQQSTRERLANQEGWTNTEKVQLGKRPDGTVNHVDMVRTDAAGNQHFAEVDHILQNGRPPAGQMDKIQSEVGALKPGQTLTWIDMNDPSRRITYNYGDNVWMRSLGPGQP